MVTVTGTGFTGGGTPTVSLGGANATGVVVVNATTIQCVTAPTAGFGPVAVTVTNTVGAGNLPNGFTYVRFPPVADPAGDVQIDTDPMTRMSDFESPQILCEGSNVYVGWVENRNAVSNDVWFNRSLDGGATWAAADTMLNTHTGIPANRFGLRMCADGNVVYATWVDDRTGVLQVHFNRSLDGGATWLAADVPIFHSAAAQQQYQVVCCDGLTFHVAWPDNRNGPNPAIFSNRSTDGGTTFLPADVPVSMAPAAFVAPADLRLCCAGGRVYAAWSDARTGDVNAYFTRSVDGGATWQPIETRVDSDAGVANLFGVALACSGTNVYVAWADGRNPGGQDVYFNRSVDGGVTFATDQRVNSSAPGTFSCIAVSVCAEGSRAHVAWVENRNGGFLEPFTRRTIDAGTTFAGPDVRLNTGVLPGTVGIGIPGALGLPICCENGSVHVVWTDARNAPRLDVFLNSSPDGGATWGASDVRLDTDLPLPGDTLLTPALCCEGPIAHAAWHDDRNNLGSGMSDVAYNRTVP
jgi:hypothetical protein